MQRSDVYEEGRQLETGMSILHRKEKGVFYTPIEIVKYMIANTLKDIDLNMDKEMKILDISCGAGYFLSEAFQYLNGKYAGKEKYIVENILWGIDINQEAIDLARKELSFLAKQECKVNLNCYDSLIYDESSMAGIENENFDYIIGNPPYIGHKKVPSEYKRKLQRLYKNIYRDKADISYCFIKRAVDLLKQGGILSFITSRYFLEGPSGVGLRKFITDNCQILNIIDFGGFEVFEDAGVATCIITLKKEKGSGKTEVMKLLHKPRSKALSFESASFSCFDVAFENLKPQGWLLLKDESLKLYELVENFGTHRLDQIFESYQGIITGCDKAFVLTQEELEIHNIERELIKPWIKNSDVQMHSVKEANKYLIYSDAITDTAHYPNAIKYIGQHRQKLETRRECKSGVREWYDLQWGRQKEIFESTKIVYPYKASKNRFAIDHKGNYCSADVYCLLPKKDIDISLEYVTAMLNSKLFQYYFKCYGKKISEDLYDYYPNTVLRMKLNLVNIDEDLLIYSKSLNGYSSLLKINPLIERIDKRIYQIYGLSEEQIGIIEKEESH